jgi:hypothetical protein
MWKAEQTTSVPATSVATTCYSLRPLRNGHAVLSYAADGGANGRGGLIQLTWDVSGGRVEWTETTADDIGDTSGLAFSVSYSAGLISVIGTSTAAFDVTMSVVSFEKADK